MLIIYLSGIVLSIVFLWALFTFLERKLIAPILSHLEQINETLLKLRKDAYSRESDRRYFERFGSYPDRSELIRHEP